MKKNIVIVGLCLTALFLLSRSCGLWIPASAYKDMRDAYNELKNITTADKKMSDARISELTNAIGQANEAIVQKERVIAEKTAQITGLSNQLDDLIANEPAQPELESQPLVISLRKQVSKLTEMFSLSQQTVTLQGEQIAQYVGKCMDLVSIVDHWTVQYEKEHALRLSAEKLVVSLEKRVKSQSLVGKAKTVAIVTIAGGLAYSILKK